MPERSAWQDARVAPPYRRAAVPRDARRVAPLNSVSREDVTVRHRLALQAAARPLPAWVSEQWDAEASEWSARPFLAGERLASSSWSEARDEPTQPVGSEPPARAWEHRPPARASAGAVPKESGRDAAEAARSATELRVRGSREHWAHPADRSRVADATEMPDAPAQALLQMFQRERLRQAASLPERLAVERSSPLAARVRPRELRADAQVLRAALVLAQSLRQCHRPPPGGGDSARRRHRANWSASSSR